MPETTKSADFLTDWYALVRRLFRVYPYSPTMKIQISGKVTSFHQTFCSDTSRCSENSRVQTTPILHNNFSTYKKCILRFTLQTFTRAVLTPLFKTTRVNKILISWLIKIYLINTVKHRGSLLTLQNSSLLRHHNSTMYRLAQPFFLDINVHHHSVCLPRGRTPLSPLSLQCAVTYRGFHPSPNYSHHLDSTLPPPPLLIFQNRIGILLTCESQWIKQ